jgi:hypothetical protein
LALIAQAATPIAVGGIAGVGAIAAAAAVMAAAMAVVEAISPVVLGC